MRIRTVLPVRASRSGRSWRASGAWLTGDPDSPRRRATPGDAALDARPG